jgi:hypothetical protein
MSFLILKRKKRRDLEKLTYSLVLYIINNVSHEDNVTHDEDNVTSYIETSNYAHK